jgi:fermentation-respiration switch protein FrsA (DUF1100 family)
VTRKPVSYKNRFGITISADLYLPKHVDESVEHAAIVVGAPYGGVKFTLTSSASFMNFPLLSKIESIAPRLILFVAGEHAHSRYFSEDAYQAAAEPKELYTVPNAGHVDLYDRTDLIPFDKLDEFFTENLASSDAVGELVGSKS